MVNSESAIKGVQDDLCCTEEKTDQVVEVQNRFVSFGSIGAIISAIFASLCCVGPLVLVMLGVSGAWIGNLRVFETYRPLFILIAIGFLCAGFYRVYRKQAEVCEPESICAAPQTKKVGKIILWITTIFVVFLLILPYLIGLLA